MKMKKIKIVLHVLLFCILVCVGTAYLENIFENKSTEAASKVYQDYGKNQFDVIFLGSSAMKNAVYPMQLYKEYGIASYNLGAGSQSTATGYYLAKEAIREHSPQVLVVDCLFTAYDKAYLSDEHLHYVTDMMSVREKWQLVSDLVEPEKWIDFMYPLYRYHSRWESITAEDVSYQEHCAYGAKVHFYSHPVGEFTITTKSKPLPEVSEKYLRMLIELCKENNVELVLTIMPVDFSTINGTLGDMDICQEYYNYIAKIAEENNVPFLNFMHIAEEVNLDYEKDFDGAFHMNGYGAPKMTRYMGEFLSNTFSLPDVRGVDSYAYMEKDYQEFIKYYNRLSLAAQKNITDYFNLLGELEGYTVILSVKDIQGYYLTPEIAESMKKIGFLSADTLLEREYHGYIGIVSNNQSVYEAVSSNHDPLLYKGNLLGKEVLVESKTLRGGNLSSIKILGKEYSKNMRGFNIVVICNETGEIVDRVCFDTHIPEFTCYR